MKQFTRARVKKWIAQLEGISNNIQDVFDGIDMTMEEAESETGDFVCSAQGSIEEAINELKEILDL